VQHVAEQISPFARRAQARLRDCPPETLSGAGEEVLAVLKDENKRVPEKEKEVKELLDAEAGDMSEHFHELVAIAQQINDFEPEAEGGEGGGEEEDEYGVAVDLDDDEDEGGPGAFGCLWLVEGPRRAMLLCLSRRALQCTARNAEAHARKL
jgi:hypothetical protein